MVRGKESCYGQVDTSVSLPPSVSSVSHCTRPLYPPIHPWRNEWTTSNIESRTQPWLWLGFSTPGQHYPIIVIICWGLERRPMGRMGEHVIEFPTANLICTEMKLDGVCLERSINCFLCSRTLMDIATSPAQQQLSGSASQSVI